MTSNLSDWGFDESRMDVIGQNGNDGACYQEASPMDAQVGGNHYSKLRIQPMRYSMENGLDACQHTAIKYITRFRDKDGIKDLEKAKHCIDMLIEFYKEELKR